MDLSFEWNPKKAASNHEKHGISFEEAISAFGDPLARIFDDPDHSRGEAREMLVGHDARRRLLVVCFVERAGRIRIVSARRATRQERQDHEEGTS